MAINYPLSWPSTPGPRAVQFFGMNAVQLTRSPFTYFTQTQQFQGEMWGCSISLPPMLRDNAEEWIAFLAQLRGPMGTFYVYDPLAVLPRGTAPGAPKVDGGSQRGISLLTKGWTPDITGILKPFDRIQIGNRLYANMTQASSDSDGKATLDIWPTLRESPPDNETIVTVRPKGLFRLSDQQTQFWSADETQVYDIAFSAVEAL